MFDKIKSFFSRIWEKVAPVAKVVGKVCLWGGVIVAAVVSPLAAVAAVYYFLWGVVAIFVGSLTQTLWVFFFAIIAGLISAICGAVVAFALQELNR